MITEWFLNLCAGVVTWFVGLFPPASAVPSWVTGAGSFVQNLINSGAGLSVWIPWGLITAVVVFQVGTWFALWVVKVARWLIGLFPTMGGG